MGEHNSQEHKEEEKKVIRYHLVRHKWPDEIKAERDKKLKIAIVTCICVACFLSGYLMNGIMGNSVSASSSQFGKLEQIYSVMANNWYFGKDVEDLEDTLLKNAITGLTTSTLDPHTMYMEPEEYQSFASSLQGNFVGIGIQYYALDEDSPMVERVYKGSGAEQGGMMKGDIIKKVNGTSVSGMTLDEISALIKGEENTKVEITVLRENEEVDLTITRSVVNDSVFGYEKNGAGVLEINTFAETSGEEVGKYLADWKQQGIKYLVIDLRDNGGGYVTAAMQIASYLIPEDEVVYKEQSKDGTIKEQRAYVDTPRYQYDQIVILINQDTASASEVLTSCLKAQLDHVTTVGVKSYGKGTVQMPITFDDGSSFKYTIAEWLSPKDEHINGVGITPDIEAALDPAISTGIPSIEEGTVFQADSVSIYAKPVQMYLKFLGYAVDRSDEYFSNASSNALKKYQSDHGLSVNGEINEETIKSLLSSCAIKWHQEQETLDIQMIKAMEVVK